MSDWIPIDERLPEVDEDGESNYILLSFSNYSLPTIGRYEVDKEGSGAFYEGDEEKNTFELRVIRQRVDAVAGMLQGG